MALPIPELPPPAADGACPPDPGALRQARTVQRHLQAPLHSHLPALDCAALSLPVHGVGGDCSDFLVLSPRRAALVLADVAGHGVPAALLAAHLQASWRSDFALAGGGLPARLQRLNAGLISRSAPGHYATLFAGEYDGRSGRLLYANCGHVPPVVLRADGGTTVLESTTTILGMFVDWECPLAEIALAPGDLLLACTDGVTEARDAAGQEFGTARWLEAARQARHLETPALLGAIAAAVQRFTGGTPQDDVTLLAARPRRPVEPQPLRARANQIPFLAREGSAP